MSRRRRAREVVLQILYQSDLNPEVSLDDSDAFVRGRLNADPKLCEFASELIRGVSSHRQTIDQRLAATADNWRLNRMAATDRAILRLGAYEILFTEMPDRVAINEAIELAKRFGTKQSAQFVNGVLDRFINFKNDPVDEVPSQTGDGGKPVETDSETPGEADEKNQ